MLATQNTGQGEVVSRGVGVTAGAAFDVGPVLRAEESEGFILYMMIVIFGDVKKFDSDMAGQIRGRK